MKKALLLSLWCAGLLFVLFLCMPRPAAAIPLRIQPSFSLWSAEPAPYSPRSDPAESAP